MSLKLEPGRTLGPYRILRNIGAGGTGSVYEVEHVKLGVRYALKVFSLDKTSKNSTLLQEKFLEEGKLLARLRHPNITRVTELAVDAETGLMYFVMDLVVYRDGEPYTIDDLDLEHIDEDLVHYWFRDICEALDYVHSMGIVHRDIKGGNILIKADKHVVLTDFGVSKIFGDSLKSDVGDASTGEEQKLVFGTEHYIAPEVAHGEEVTPQADAFALGVLLVRLLTGSWYDKDPSAFNRLPHAHYRWSVVVRLLLAEKASQRPAVLSQLVRMLELSETKVSKGTSAGRSLTIPRRAAHKKPKAVKPVRGLHPPRLEDETDGSGSLRLLICSVVLLVLVALGLIFQDKVKTAFFKAQSSMQRTERMK